MPQNQSSDPNVHDGPVRTDIYCHDCSKTFIGELDFRIDGNHIIECPYCSHEHCRVIEGGKITSDRWSSRYKDQVTRVDKKRMWKHPDLPIRTSTSCEFIRHRWLNFGLE
jgi:DNA-directed RNA polymerase subunit RPC12/RpoP